MAHIYEMLGHLQAKPYINIYIYSLIYCITYLDAILQRMKIKSEKIKQHL